MIKVVRLDQYGAEIVFCSTLRDFGRVVGYFYSNSEELIDECKRCQGYTVSDSPIVMYARKDHGTIAHEAVHAASDVLGPRGVTTAWPHEESLAYPVGWIVERWHERNGWMTGAAFDSEMKNANKRKKVTKKGSGRASGRIEA